MGWAWGSADGGGCGGCCSAASLRLGAACRCAGLALCGTADGGAGCSAADGAGCSAALVNALKSVGSCGEGAGAGCGLFSISSGVTMSTLSGSDDTVLKGCASVYRNTSATIDRCAIADAVISGRTNCRNPTMIGQC